ncbi:histidine phosphatase family protein [Succinimonas amylolytica]|uniref:histidine phosphatase family protein n=1 Tax=Succinimonas amylolytica TaxID=83769 RepID=UPI0023A912BA
MNYIETDIIFLRHCAIDGPRAFYGSGTDIGCIRESLANVPKIPAGYFAEVFVSPMKRCRETLEATGISGSITVAPDLRELGFGSIDGKPFAEFSEKEKEILAALNRGENVAFPGGENAEDLKQRTGNFIETVLKAEHAIRESRRILAVTHSGIISTVLQRILECPILNILQKASPGLGRFTGIRYFQDTDRDFSVASAFPRILFLNSATPGN